VNIVDFNDKTMNISNCICNEESAFSEDQYVDIVGFNNNTMSISDLCNEESDFLNTFSENQNINIVDSSNISDINTVDNTSKLVGLLTQLMLIKFLILL